MWSSASYEPHLLSLPFALAPAAMMAVIAYTAVMRGAPALRGWLLAHFLSLLPYATAVMLAPSVRDPRAAEQLFRTCVSSIPLAAAAGAGFQYALLGLPRAWRIAAWIGAASALVWIPISSSSHAAIDGVVRIGGSLWYPTVGRWAWLALLHTIVLSAPGFWLMSRAARRMGPSAERRQLRAMLLANAITYSGLIDVSLAYGAPIVPIGWLLSGIGSLLVARALVVEDVLRSRALDTTAPRFVVYAAAGVLLGWIALAQLGHLAWWVLAIGLVLTFASVRLSVATVALINRGARDADGPLERLLAQLVTRARPLSSPTAIAQLSLDILELGLGVRGTVLLAAAEDWGWTTDSGTRVPDERAPDPLLASWLAEQRGVRFANDLDAAPDDLRELLARLFAQQDARAIAPITSGDELLGLVLIPREAPAQRGKSLAFLERAAERLAEALVHARLAARAADRAALAREVELAATVQAELLPGPGLHSLDGIDIVGSWHPASRCAGDFWGVYKLGGGRLLVCVGDVTGHGIASAMVTAAAAGASNVHVRKHRASLDLVALATAVDAAVRRVGGGMLAMTCAAAILDPAAGELHFLSAGHPAPYLARIAGDSIELQALVARGNPLGGGTELRLRVLTRELRPGDLVVWYTDGVIEAQDPRGVPYGDRRLQQLLRKLDRARAGADAVHGAITASVAGHRAGVPLADDATLVVARVAPSSGAA
ncbi:MAG TPA: PP2C family protein-serine/threonine phosphatase [Kofleriaceae bacterium]|jgi:serine phosphatase RsbU (regulator of sigma subunit)